MFDVCLGFVVVVVVVGFAMIHLPNVCMLADLFRTLAGHGCAFIIRCQCCWLLNCSHDQMWSLYQCWTGTRCGVNKGDFVVMVVVGGGGGDDLACQSF